MDMPQLADAFKKHSDQTSAMMAELKTGLQSLADWRLEQEKKANRPGNGGDSGQDNAESAAKKVFEAEGFKAFKEGTIKQLGVSVDAESILRKSVFSGDYPGQPQVAPLVTPPQRRVFLRQRMPFQIAESGTIKFARQTFTSNAGPQTDNASPPTFEGADKPESDISWTPHTIDVGTFAHWVRMSTQALDDIPNLRQQIETGLTYGLEMEIENQIINGTGANGDMEGLLKSGNYTAYNGGYGAGHQAVDVIRRAITQLEIAEYDADIVILNPLDWGNTELLKDGENRYLIGDPIGAALSNLWRRPVYTTPKLASGKFIVANLQLATQFWMRKQILLMIGFVDKDFIQNMVRMLAECRAAQTVYRPAAVIYGNLSG